MKDNNGDYPVTIALEWGLADILQTILAVPEAQLDLSVTDLYGDNVAQIAVESSEGEREKCFELISQVERVDWNLKNSYGETPVMFCLKTNKTAMARVLLNQCEVDLDTVDTNELHLEDIAREQELRDILDLLFQFTSVQQRMIQWDATKARKAQAPPSLQSLARDAVVLRLCWCGQHHTNQACHHTGTSNNNNYRNRLFHLWLLTPVLSCHRDTA